MELLQTLKQMTTVNGYIDAYEQWMTLMKREKPYLQTDFFIDRFISGLKEGIRHTVLRQKPDSLMSAYWYARLYEKAHLANNKRPIIPAQQQRPNNFGAQRPAAVRDNRVQNREPRKCWYCPENWTIGHKCHQMQLALNIMEMQGNYLDELPAEEQAPLPRDPEPAV